MKKLTTLLVAVVLASSAFVQANNSPAKNKKNKQQPINVNVDNNQQPADNNQAPVTDKPGFFSRQMTNLKSVPSKIASMPRIYVEKNMRLAQYAGDKLGLGIAKAPVAVPAFGPVNEKDEAVVSTERTAIEAHPYRATAVVTSALAGTVYGIYKLGQYTGVNAKIAKAFDALCSKLGFVSEEEQIKTAIVNCKNVLAQKGLPADAIADAKAQLAKLEAALKNTELRAEALANVEME